MRRYDVWLYALVCGLFVSRWVLAALGKSEPGLYGVVGGITVIVMLAYTMRLLRGGIAAVEDMRQAYIVKHIRKSLTLLGYAPNFYSELQAMGLHRLQRRRK